MRLLIMLFLLSLATPLNANERQENVLHQGDVLKRSPDGGDVAEIIYTNRGRRIKRQGDWVKVEVKGYIWRASTRPFKEVVQMQDELPVVPVTLSDYTINWQPQDLQREDGPKRAHVTAEFRFTTQDTPELSCLDYRVHFYNLQGRPLHQVDVKCGSAYSVIEKGEYVQQFIWKEYNGSAGEVYRRMEKDAQQNTIRIDLSLQRAYFINGDSIVFSNTD